VINKKNPVQVGIFSAIVLFKHQSNCFLLAA